MHEEQQRARAEGRSGRLCRLAPGVGGAAAAPPRPDERGAETDGEYAHLTKSRAPSKGIVKPNVSHITERRPRPGPARLFSDDV